MDNKKKKKALLLSLAMAVALSLPVGVSAQDGLFQRGIIGEANSQNENSSFLGHRSQETTGIINNQTFGQELPIGNGVFLLFVAGVSYAILRRKEDEK